MLRSVHLADLPLGVVAPVSHVVAGDGIRIRLAELGIRPGVAVSCVQRCAGGGRVVRVGNARLALDRAALRAVQLEAPVRG